MNQCAALARRHVQLQPRLRGPEGGVQAQATDGSHSFPRGAFLIVISAVPPKLLTLRPAHSTSFGHAHRSRSCTLTCLHGKSTSVPAGPGCVCSVHASRLSFHSEPSTLRSERPGSVLTPGPGLVPGGQIPAYSDQNEPCESRTRPDCSLRWPGGRAGRDRLADSAHDTET